MARPSPFIVPAAGTDTRVLLVHAPYPGELKFEGQPSSLLIASEPLARQLAAEGRLAELGLLDPRRPSEDFYSELETLASGDLAAVCISTSTAAIEEAAKIAHIVRSASGGRALVIAGGPHEDDVPQPMAHRSPAVDLSISGDAGDALVSVVLNKLEASSGGDTCVEPATYRGRGQISVRGGKGTSWNNSPIGAQDLLVRPWSTRPVKFSVFPERETVPVMISRGCSYGRCTFCAEADGLGQRVVSDFSPLEELIARHPDAAIYFQDSIFPFTPAVASTLLPLLRNSGRPWGCQVYLRTLSKRLVAALAEHGCTYAYTGIESGSEKLRAAVGKPKTPEPLVRERLAWLRDAGIRVGLSLMFGIIDETGSLLETESSIDETVRFALGCLGDGVPVEGFYPNVLTVLPGTAVAAGLSQGGIELDFYSMPRVPEFEELEDGAVGYNFASLGLVRGPKRSRLADTIAAASSHLSSLCTRAYTDGEPEERVRLS